jgi:photosystem II CP43 chlorophyll apoprotein
VTEEGYNGHAILSYSLAGVALMAFTSAYFVAFNDLAFPPEFYGVDRSLFVGVQSLLCATFLGGHVWRALKGKAEASNSNVVSDGDKSRATLAGFIVLAIVIVSLVSIARLKI